MTVRLGSVKTDLDLQAKGTWVDYPEWPGVRFLVRGLQSEPYATQRQLALDQLSTKYRGAKNVPLNEIDRAAGELYAAHILLDWDGFDEPFTRERAREVLTDPGFKRVLSAVEWAAATVGRGDLEFVEEQVKNSEAPSGKS